MNTKKNRPDARQLAFEAEGFQCKNSKISFQNPIRQRIYEILLSGKKVSVIQLSVILRIPDPRSHIRYIRDAGVPVKSFWERSEFSKYKVYFLKG